MSRISVKDAVKRYGNNTVIPDLDLEIGDGELFTLLGPSGCGKTTLLRMIAGFNSIEGGDIFFNEKRINDMDPSKRNIGMVFQNYAIFPNLSVRDNVAFGLKNRKVDKAEIKKRTDEFLNLMQIMQYADRMPNQLSGGQQQRIALARALVISPDVLLMDEPLSNLDAKLRVEMRSVIRHTQKSVGITTVYVTHDQEEAMAISDRIAVMKDGVIQHVGTPRDIYQRPKNVFVATFIGRTNIVNAHVKDGIITESYGESKDSVKKTKKQVRTFAITAVDTIAGDQTGALSWVVFSVIDASGNDHIMTLSRVDPAALTGEGNDTYFELKCDMFHNENGYSNNRCAESAKFNGIDGDNFKKAIDGLTKEFKRSVIEYLLANHSTTTELTWDGTVIENFNESTRTLTFGIKNATNADEDSLPSILVIYHTDTHEFEEVDVQ